MSEEDLDLREFAKKIALVFYHQAIISLKKQLSNAHKGLKGVHLPYGFTPKKFKSLSPEELISSFKKASKVQDDLKHTEKISTDKLFDTRFSASNPGDLFQVAFEAHKCSRNQDLHLLAFKQLLLENGLSLRQIKSWKLPESMIAKKNIDKWITHMNAFYEEIQKHHKIKKLDPENKEKKSKNSFEFLSGIEKHY